MSTMKAVGYKQAGDIARADSLTDVIRPKPTATGRDLLVEIKAVSVNPADTKIRANIVDNADLQLKKEILMSGPSGICLNCEKVILLHSEECKFCSAEFGEHSVWSVKPFEY